MVNYQNSKIYKLMGDKTGENMIFYGSTVQPLTKCLYSHKMRFKNNNMMCPSTLLFLFNDNIKIYLVCKCPCNDREELNKFLNEVLEKNNNINNENLEEIIKELENEDLENKER